MAEHSEGVLADKRIDGTLWFNAPRDGEKPWSMTIPEDRVGELLEEAGNG